MIPGGYILQPRLFDASGAAKMPPVAREVWLYVLRNVNHKDSKKFKRGSNFFNISDIREALSWKVGYRKMMYSKTQVTKALRRLCEDSMTTSTKTSRGLIITVCNYDYYQNPKNYEDSSEDSAKTQRRLRQGHTINKNGKNKEKETPKHNGKFIEPSLEEIKKYCLERENTVDAEKWFNFYESKGWMIGKNKMRNWKAAVRTWEEAKDKQSSGPKVDGVEETKRKMDELFAG